MFNVTTVLPHNLLQTNPCIRHNFSTQVFRKRATQLHYVGPELRYIFWSPWRPENVELILIGWEIVSNKEHVQCNHRFASQLSANKPLHSSQLFDTSLQKARHNFTMWALSCATFSGLLGGQKM